MLEVGAKKGQDTGLEAKVIETIVINTIISKIIVIVNIPMRFLIGIVIFIFIRLRWQFPNNGCALGGGPFSKDYSGLGST